jgi:hypothetical protein
VSASIKTISFTDPDQARSDLREGIESSREMLRQSRMLLELSESDGIAHDDRASDYPGAN